MKHNVFLNLIYNKEFNNNSLKEKISNYFSKRKLIKTIKKNPPTFDLIWQFIEYLKWMDIIYGFTMEMNYDIDLLKKRNPYFINNSGELVDVSFSIIVDERSTINFKLVKEYKEINIAIKRDKISISEEKTSSISFIADEDEYSFSQSDQLIICEINRLLQEKMIRYIDLYYDRIY